MTRRLAPSAVNTPTLKHDRHFLLVDDKVGLKEDAENDPGDLWGREKAKCEESQCEAQYLTGGETQATGEEHQWRMVIWNHDESSSQWRPLGPRPRMLQASFWDNYSTIASESALLNAG